MLAESNITTEAFKTIIETFTVIENTLYEFSMLDNNTIQYDYWCRKHYTSLHIKDLYKMTKLDLSLTSIVNLPSEFGYLSTLEFLDLSGNNISQLPECIWNLNNLKELNLGSVVFGGNAIQTISPKIKNLKDLEILNISLNDKLQTLPQEILELKKLLYLRMTQNELYNSDIVQRLINETNCCVLFEETLPPIEDML